MIWETILEDFIIKTLIAGAAVTIILGLAIDGVSSKSWVEGVAILVAVVIVLTVTAGNDYSKDKKFKKLLLLQSDKKTKLIRGGKVDQVSSWDLLVGDIVELVVGDEIPADGIFIKGNRVVIDESPLTGESVGVKKTNKAPFLFSGCQVSEGTLSMLVTAVGPRSSGGKIQVMLSEAQTQETVLQTKLRELAILIGKIGMAAGLLTFFGLLIPYLIHVFSHDNKLTDKEKEGGEILKRVLEFFNVSITIIVVAVPEGLPLAVTISLAFSMFRMIKDRCFVRHLNASETMGQATAICSDKTGTLTENKMTVVKILLGRDCFNGKGAGEYNDVPYSSATFSTQVRDFLCESLCVNSNCFLKKSERGENIFVGSATEGAMLVLSQSLGLFYEDVRKNVSKVENGEYLFTSDRKRMSTLCEPRVLAAGQVTPPLFRLYTKGASEIVFSLCSSQLSADLTYVKPIQEEDHAFISSKIKAWASEGLRTIAIAYRDYDRPLSRSEREDPEHDLVFVGLIGIKDPVRSGVPGAVRTCQEAGIIVRMVTGDNILTASKIARECNILNEHGVAMEGPVFRALSETEKKAVIPRLQVLARSSPADKHTLVSLLKSMGEVVAVTGDGTNDAPALKEADVGFAMGISGTQIAMNASDIILLDDNFISIVQSIKWGRNVLNAVRKFLQFQLAVNLVAVASTIIGAIGKEKTPFSPVQLLWVNLIMDSFGALGLASDVPDERILKARPTSRTEPILSPSMKTYIFFQFIFQVGVISFLMWSYKDVFPHFVLGLTEAATIERQYTFIFTTFVLMQIVNEIFAKQLNHELNFVKGFFSNQIFPCMLVVIIVIQVISVQFLGAFMGTVALTAEEWEMCIVISLIMAPYLLLVRLGIMIYRKHKGAGFIRVLDSDADNAEPNASTKAIALISQSSAGSVIRSEPLI
jgi:Ca2+-transporting ATPase